MKICWEQPPGTVPGLQDLLVSLQQIAVLKG